jgi:hypothetical protein
MDRVTRGSRCKFCTLRHAPIWPETIWSPSTPTHTRETWGLPSGSRVTMWAVLPAVTTRLTSSVMVVLTAVASSPVDGNHPGEIRRYRPDPSRNAGPGRAV